MVGKGNGKYVIIREEAIVERYGLGILDARN